MIAYEFSYTNSNIVLSNFNDNIEIVNTNTNTKNYSEIKYCLHSSVGRALV